jgi:hypothetical protein
MRCDQMVRKGTGYGACNKRLDEHEQCPNAGAHLSSAEVASTLRKKEMPR